MSKNALAALAVAASTFIHFRNPATNEPLFVTDESQDDGFARDANGDKMPIGVKVYGPGSRQYRAAQSAITTATLHRGARKMTGELVFENQTNLLARTTTEFVNFDYNDETINGLTAAEDEPKRLRIARAFYADPVFAAAREQVEEKQGDLGNFSLTASNV